MTKTEKLELTDVIIRQLTLLAKEATSLSVEADAKALAQLTQSLQEKIIRLESRS